MKLATILALIQMVSEVNKLVVNIKDKPTKDAPKPKPAVYLLDYAQCCFVVYVYRMTCQYNITHPLSEITDEQLVVYYNFVFHNNIPLKQYKRIWQKFKPNKGLL